LLDARIGGYHSVVSEPDNLRIGTSAFTAAGWPGTFYPERLPEREYLTYYATKFDTVEIDSTFYRIPSEKTVRGWDQDTQWFRFRRESSAGHHT
jgi:uncharacterized protein YecE (DUF72 family)